MSKYENIICIVPARSGSKMIKDKNLLKINGKTLIENALDSASEILPKKNIYISTDSKKYEDIATSAGYQSQGLRNIHLAKDDTKTFEVIKDFISILNREVSAILMLQPTSPFRAREEIEDAIELFFKKRETVFSISEQIEPHPYKMLFKENLNIKPIFDKKYFEFPKQKLPKTYSLNGAIYVFSLNTIIQFNSIYSENPEPFIIDRRPNIDTHEDYIAALEYAKIYAK
tara:strand:- start:9674 stop:10360 length:687 start_codon:yes stop_codon:yes gene_type:complete